MHIEYTECKETLCSDLRAIHKYLFMYAQILQNMKKKTQNVKHFCLPAFWVSVP